MIRRIAFDLFRPGAALACMLALGTGAEALAQDSSSSSGSATDSQAEASSDASNKFALGAMLDVGAPDGVGISAVVRPARWLRVNAGLTTNTLSLGVRGGISLVPLTAFITPSINLDLGHYFDANYNELVDRFGGIPLQTRAPINDVGFNYGGDPFAHLAARSGTVANLPALEAAASGNGAFTVDPDPDGIHRRVPLLFSHAGELYPSLAAEAVRVASGARSYSIKTAGSSGEASFGKSTGITQLRIGKEFTVPTNSRGEIWVWYTQPVAARYVPAWEVLAGNVDRQKIEGNIVLVGTTAAGLRDVRATPLDPVSPGVAVHAQIIEQILLGEYLERPDWATGAELLYLFALGLPLALLIPRVGAVGTALLGGSGIAVAVALSWYAYSSWRWLLDPIYPGLAALGVYLVGSLQNFLQSEAQRRSVRRAFSRYLSPTLVDELAADPARLRLGGEMRDMTLLFCDVRGFTTLSEQLDPHALTHLVNRFLTPMTDIILAARGFIDKYMGDAIMAFWNAPLDDPEHPRHACEAALSMLKALEQLNVQLARGDEGIGRPLAPLAVGIGINTGLCCVGNMGSDQRFDYSVISDEVNLASRLEGQSPTYGVSIVIGESTRVRVATFACLELDRIRVKGKTHPVRIYTLLGGEALASSERFQELVKAHDAMLAAYRGQRWEEALAAISECRRLGPDLGLEQLHRLYETRVAGFRSAPPPPEWDGVYVASSK